MVVPALVEALRDLFAYVHELEQRFTVNVAVRGDSFPHGAAELGARVQSVLAAFEQEQEQR